MLAHLKISTANKHRHITPKHRISDFLPADSFAVTKLTKWVAACLCHTFGSSLVKVAHYNSRSIPSASPVHLFDKSPALHSTYRTPTPGLIIPSWDLNAFYLFIFILFFLSIFYLFAFHLNFRGLKSLFGSERPQKQSFDKSSRFHLSSQPLAAKA